MDPGLTLIDFVVLGIFATAMVAVGVWTGRRQSTSDDFFFADRSLSWWPLGLSLSVAGLAAVFYCQAPYETYSSGMKLLLVPMLVWAALPVVVWLTIPLYGSLQLDSVYEYLELRFDPATRVIAGVIYVVWQLLWIGGILLLPCMVLNVGTRLSVPVLAAVVGVGAVSIVYTSLGGMKATVFTDVAQFAVMAVGVVLLLGAVAANLDDGLAQIADAAERLQRSVVIDTAFDWSATWSVWSAAPFLAVATIFFFVADQTTLQRLFSACDDRDMKLSYLLSCGLFSILTAAAVYAGLGLLAVYHDNAQAEISPNWVVNSARDAETGQPLIGPRTVVDAQTIGQLVAQGKILDPNTDEPLADAGDLVNARGEVIINRLATRKTRSFDGERILRSGRGELVGRFIGRHLPWGLAGLFVAATFAAAMAVVDSGLGSMATIITIDFHRRFGWAETWLARQCGKTPGELDQTDELRLARLAVPVLGVAAMLIALLLAELGHPVRFLLGALGLFAGPLLGVFLLGLFTRRATAPAVLVGLALGILTAAWATFGHLLPEPVWPFPAPLSPFWPLPFGLAATLVSGYLFSFLLGRRKSRRELSGLVAGVGRLGVLLDVEEKQEKLAWIDPGDEQPEGPWS